MNVGRGSSTMPNADFNHLLGKARDGKLGGKDAWSVQSRGEKVAVALVLDRADWLQDMGYTLPEAIDRTGREWILLVPLVARAAGRRRLWQ
ncbi:MAG: hypothetical protein JF606_18465 [Burkholderiales bacterium]|nr:hypothetical protein [Burkholderiales bacterium]